MKKIEQQLEREIEELKDHVRWLKWLMKNNFEIDIHELMITEDLIELKLDDLGEVR